MIPLMSFLVLTKALIPWRQNVSEDY